MIRLVLPIDPDSGHGLDLTCPVIVCDACGNTIVGEGNLLWNPDDDRDQFHTHKGSCDRTLDPVHALHSRELGEWLRQLTHNLAEPLTGVPLPIGMDGDPYTVAETRTLADEYAGTELISANMPAAAARARAIRDSAHRPHAPIPAR